MPETNKIWTVTALNRELRKLLDSAFTPMWITGEVSNLKIHQSGHVYFSLKDEKSQVRAVMFNGANFARSLGLENGMEVETFGKVRIYEAYGQYQIYVDEIRLGGEGRLQREFEALKKKLQAEGLFDPERKQRIPEIPQCVGLITSVNGAAIKDFLNVVERRFPGLHIRIIDARMQGADSAPQVIRAIRYLNRNEACDVIVLTRGGGSAEDLWCFNDEELVRQVAASEIPIISAIGHEVDFTLAEFASDLRAATPSAAAELVVGARAALRDKLGGMQRRLVGSLDLLHHRLLGRLDRARSGVLSNMAGLMHDRRRRLDQIAGHYLFQQPELILQPHQQRVADATERLPVALDDHVEGLAGRLREAGEKLRLLTPDHKVAVTRQRLVSTRRRLRTAVQPNLEAARQTLTRLQSQLRALDPRRVLGRGYSILISRETGKAIQSADQVETGEVLRGVLSKGELDLEVRDKRGD